MKYLLMIYCDEASDARRSKEELDREMGAYLAYTEKVRKSGAYVAGSDGRLCTGRELAVRTAMRVLPVPPGPVSVTRRARP